MSVPICSQPAQFGGGVRFAAWALIAVLTEGAPTMNFWLAACGGTNNELKLASCVTMACSASGVCSHWMNCQEASLFFEYEKMLMPSPPTNESLLPPGPTGSGATAHLPL